MSAIFLCAWVYHSFLLAFGLTTPTFATAFSAATTRAEERFVACLSHALGAAERALSPKGLARVQVALEGAHAVGEQHGI